MARDATIKAKQNPKLSGCESVMAAPSLPLRFAFRTIDRVAGMNSTIKHVTVCKCGSEARDSLELSGF